MKKKIILSWSGGKDAAYSLYKLQQNPEFEVVGLLTTLNEVTRKVMMHQLDEKLIEAQAESIGLPLYKVYLDGDKNDAYELRMREFLERIQSQGVFYVAFGDIHLEDLKKYREQKLREAGMTAYFPIWKKDTTELLNKLMENGFKTITCCVEEKKVGRQLLGQIIDEKFSSKLPSETDACGENGEYHTFCFDGPIFKHPIPYTLGPETAKSYTWSDGNGQKSTSEFRYLEIQPVNC